MQWLYAIGVVPNNVIRLATREVKTDLDREEINCGYLAASAYEWDVWGPSTPDEFLDAIECELSGSNQKSAIYGVLLALGRDASAEVIDQ